MVLKDNLIKLREDNDLSIVELGFKINVDAYTIYKWEKGRLIPNAIEGYKLLKYYNINFNDFFK